jgi:hypothetical protein
MFKRDIFLKIVFVPVLVIGIIRVFVIDQGWH